jgi:hypothetical protein
VAFLDASRTMPWYISAEAENRISILLPPNYADDPAALAAHLRSLLPQVPAMQAEIARHATRLQYSYSELSAEDHAAVGPDALDMALYAMTAHMRVSEEQAPGASGKDASSLSVNGTHSEADAPAQVLWNRSARTPQ